MYSVMWSEHCSYKSSQGAPAPVRGDPAGDRRRWRGKMLAGIGENAGVVDIGQGYAVTFKIESHNHPSYVEPYQGAATGVGGIVRDILAMGARPVAVMDPLRFGPLSEPDTHRVLPGIVAGVGGYGNCLGLPNIGGEAVFDASLPRQPAGQRALRRRAPARGPPPRQGDRRRQPGRAVRRPDGRRRHRRRQRAGVGDVRRRRSGQAAQRPGRRPVHGEAAHRVHARALRRRHRHRHPGPRRRRALVRDVRAGQRRRRRHARRARPGAAARLLARARGDPDERVAGTHDGRRRARATSSSSWRSAPSGTSRPSSSARSPTPAGCGSTGTASRSSTCRRVRWRTTGRRTTVRSSGRTGRTPSRATAPRGCRGRRTATSCARPCCGSSRAPNLCDKSWITDQYDRYVRGNTVLAQPSDSGMIRVDEETGLGVVGRDRLQRAVRQARPVRRRAAGARRGLPQRRRPAAPRRSRSATASTSARPRTRP